MVNRFPRGNTATISHSTVCPSHPWICLSHSDSGLVKLVCHFLGAFHDTGHRILFGGAAESTPDLEAGDFQHGPGAAVHERGFHGSSGKCGDQNKHEWTRAGV